MSAGACTVRKGAAACSSFERPAGVDWLKPAGVHSPQSPSPTSHIPYRVSWNKEKGMERRYRTFAPLEVCQSACIQVWCLGGSGGKSNSFLPLSSLGDREIFRRRSFSWSFMKQQCQLLQTICVEGNIGEVKSAMTRNVRVTSLRAACIVRVPHHLAHDLETPLLPQHIREQKIPSAFLPRFPNTKHELIMTHPTNYEFLTCSTTGNQIKTTTSEHMLDVVRCKNVARQKNSLVNCLGFVVCRCLTANLRMKVDSASVSRWKTAEFAKLVVQLRITLNQLNSRKLQPCSLIGNTWILIWISSQKYQQDLGILSSHFMKLVCYQRNPYFDAKRLRFLAFEVGDFLRYEIYQYL